MPGYIIHLCAARELLYNFRSEGRFQSAKEQNDFLVSALIPDAVSDKKITHFRQTDDPAIQLRYPLPWRFYDRYASCCSTPQGMGFLFHLYTDYLFYHEYFNRHILLTDDNDALQVEKNKITRAHLVDFNHIIPGSDLFSNTYIYDDYTILNAMLEEEYGLTDSDYDFSPVENPGIKEAFYENIGTISEELHYYSRLSRSFSGRDTKVFKKEPLLAFIKQTAPRFLFNYSELFR